MRAYRERLVVPASWWLWATGCVLLLGTTLWAGFSVSVGLIVYVVLEAICAALFISWGRAAIWVTETELRAGQHRLPLSQVSEVAALDAVQTRALRGPRADPAAYLVVRPYLPRSVYVELAGRPAGQPYWLIGTRNPERLAGAIDRARPRGGGRPACDDADGDRQGGEQRPADAPGHVGAAANGAAANGAANGEDGNAWKRR